MFRSLEVSGIEITVANTVVSICQHLTIVGSTFVHQTVEPLQCLGIVLLLEVCVTHAIKCQSILLALLVSSDVQVFLQVLSSRYIIVQAIVGLASPIVGIRLSRSVVLSYRQRAVEILFRLREICICEGLCTQTEKDFLLGFHNTWSRLRDLGNGCQCRIVTAGVHIDFHQVVVHTFAIAGIRELIQEAFEHGYRFGKWRIGCFVDAKRIVVQSLFLHRLVVISNGRLLKCHASLVALLQL